MADKGHGDELVAKRLATGEIAVWDATRRVVMIINADEKKESLKLLRGKTLKEIEKQLGGIVVLV